MSTDAPAPASSVYHDLMARSLTTTGSLFSKSFGTLLLDDVDTYGAFLFALTSPARKRIRTSYILEREYSNLRDVRKPVPSASTSAVSEPAAKRPRAEDSTALTLAGSQSLTVPPPPPSATSTALTLARIKKRVPKPEWHPSWKLTRVRAVAVDPTNEWFATGSADRTIKIWDLASGTLRLTLTGHVHTVRGLAISDRHPYMFSCGEDKMIKCWDLEYNKVVRHYHGHLSGIYCMALHPTLDILATGGRDSCARVWDMRTKNEIYVLGGHSDTVSSLLTQAGEPQLITGSEDHTMRLWDLRNGKKIGELTHHKKGIRAMAFHPRYAQWPVPSRRNREYTWISCATDNVKKWACPKGEFLYNFQTQSSVINTCSVNEDNICFTGADDGTMKFWDYSTGYCFQSTKAIPQPGSLDSEAGVYASTFDRTGSRLITGEADKSIKIWKENPDATEESEPIETKKWEEFYRRPQRG